MPVIEVRAPTSFLFFLTEEMDQQFKQVNGKLDKIMAHVGIDDGK